MFLFRNDKYKGYPKEMKEWYIHRDKYLPYFQKSSEYTQNIVNYYSLFINNNLNEKYFKKLIENCKKYIELEPILEQAQIEENKINHTNYALPNSSIAYKYMILAYEKLQDYNTALNLCNEAISKGYTEDGTKYGYKGRIKRINKKING